MKSVLITNPFDAHIHWRQLSTIMRQVAQYSMQYYSGGLLMPNTDPKITSIAQLRWYLNELVEVIGITPFLALMTYYLSEELTKNDLHEALKIDYESAKFAGVKYYPKGGTTSSDKGLEGFAGVSKILDEMQKLNIPLLVHGETPLWKGSVVDDFEREDLFFNTEAQALRRRFPELRIVFEHITTAVASEFVVTHEHTFATITPQHCLIDRRGLFNKVVPNARDTGGVSYSLEKNGMQPDHMCRPILKHQHDLEAIQDVLIKQTEVGWKKFGLGTDSAPHEPHKKYCDCCACGMFTAPIALPLYAMAFEEMGILEHLPIFASVVMPEFYGITDRLPKKQILLEKKEMFVDANYWGIIPPFSKEILPWLATVL